MTSLVFHDFTFPIFAPVSICHQMSTTLLLKNDVIYMNGPNVVTLAKTELLYTKNAGA